MQPRDQPHPSDAGPGLVALTLRRRTALNAVLLLVARTLSRLVVLVSVILAQNGLGGERYGEFATAIVFSAISSIAADLGLQVVFTREASRHPEQIGDLLAVTLGAKVPLSAASGLVLAGGMALLSPSLLHLVPEVFALLVVTSVATLLRSCFYATGEMRWEVIAITGETTVLVGLTIAAFKAHAGVGAYIDAYTASYLATMLFAGAVVRRRYARIRLSWQPDRLRWLLRSGLPFALGFVLTTIYFRIDVVILQGLRGFAQVGYYNAAYKFLDGLSFVPQAVMNAVYPALSVLAAQGARPMRRAYARAYRMLALLGVPTTVGVALLAEPIVRVTHTLPEAAPSLRILALSLVFIFVVNTFVFALGAMDRQLTFALLTGTSVAVNVVLNLVMIPLFAHADGYLAASWATVVTEALLCAGGLYALSRYLGSEPWLRTVLPALASGLCMAAATWPVRDRSLWLSVPVATLTFVVAAFLTRAVTREDVAEVVAAARGG